MITRALSGPLFALGVQADAARATTRTLERGR